jgi:ferric-dicitrate binding protein FerR (iron transport regulator)
MADVTKLPTRTEVDEQTPRSDVVKSQMRLRRTGEHSTEIAMKRHHQGKLQVESFDRRLLLRALASATIVIPRSSWAETPEQVGSVAEVRGEAFAEARTQRRTLDRAAPLFMHDLVVTGTDSRLTLSLGNYTTLRVGGSARLIIDRFLVGVGGDITLQSGPILLDRQPGGTPARLQIRSTFGEIAVRGTRFFAGPSAGVFGVFVERGSVVVSGAGKQVLVPAGQGTNIASPGAVPTPATAWKPERIRAALESVQ